MFHTAFAHNDPDRCHGKELSLHDCIAEKISYKDGILRFSFSDGFWVTTHHEANHLNKTVRTDAAQVDFHIDDLNDIEVHVYTQSIFKKTTVKFWGAHDLINAVNSNKCTLEFLYQYRTSFEQLWHCVLRSGKKPYYRDLYLHLPGADAVYRWNSLLSEREW